MAENVVCLALILWDQEVVEVNRLIDGLVMYVFLCKFQLLLLVFRD